MYGIKAAVRRLEFAPDPKDMRVTDIKTGRFVFRPRPGKPVSLEQLEKAVTKAGYQIEKTRIEVTGTLAGQGGLRVPVTGQVFRLMGEQALRRLPKEGRVTVAGGWKREGGAEALLLDEPGPEEKRP